MVQDVVEGVRDGMRTGRPAVLGRVIDIRGFSTLPGDGLVAIDSAGTQYGDILGRPGSERLRAAAASLLSDAAPGLETVTIAIKDKDVEEIGLACGGQAEVLLQPVASVPAELWDLMARRASVALLTRIEGSGAGPAALVVDRDGRTWGGLGTDAGPLVDEARAMLETGTTSTRRLEDQAGVVLIEAWVPAPRMVVVGTGELVAALDAQGALLGWDCRSTGQGDDLEESARVGRCDRGPDRAQPRPSRRHPGTHGGLGARRPLRRGARVAGHPVAAAGAPGRRRGRPRPLSIGSIARSGWTSAAVRHPRWPCR